MRHTPVPHMIPLPTVNQSTRHWQLFPITEMRNLEIRRKNIEKLGAYFFGGWIFWDLTAAKFLDGKQQVGRTPTSLTVEEKSTWLIKRWNDTPGSTRRNICNNSVIFQGWVLQFHGYRETEEWRKGMWGRQQNKRLRRRSTGLLCKTKEEEEDLGGGAFTLVEP